MAIREDKIIKPFFSHDYAPLEDKNLLKLFITLGAEGYGIYWLIVEFMHQNTFVVGEEELLAYKIHVDVEKIKRVMNDFELFRVEETEQGKIYISDRILRNLNYVEQKNEARTQAANVRWLLSAFNKSYVEFFGEEPILQTEEIENLKKYNEKIPDLKAKLRDIIYTLKNLKFDTDVNFKPCANWLLKDNNLARLVNGEFGALKHKKTEKELKQEQQKLALEEAERNKPSELELQIESVSGKYEALELIAKYYEDKQIVKMNGRACLVPSLKDLMKKFDITDKEVFERCANE
jgi:hypothetical protein